MNAEEGTQSGDDRSVLHSPVFGAGFSPQPDSFRYQHDHLDVHRAAGILAPQYHYSAPLNVQQPPLLDTRLVLPTPSAQHVTFSPHFPVMLPHRNHLAQTFPVQPQSDTRPSIQNGGIVDFRFTPTERRLPGGPSHDQSYSRSLGQLAGLTAASDQKPPTMPSPERKEPSTNTPVNSSREPRKGVSTVVIACRQCRGRKIRCDSTKPVCQNCVRRNNVCEYDPAPKRRGPDKRPGTRQRSCKKRPADGSAPPPPKRKRTNAAHPADLREPTPLKVKENLTSAKHSPSSLKHPDRPQEVQQQPNHNQILSVDVRLSTDPISIMKSEQPRRYPSYGNEQGVYNKTSFPRPLDVNTFPTDILPRNRFQSSSPIVENEQQYWWDDFLARVYPMESIKSDISFLFENTGYWLSFLNLEYFITRLHNEHERNQIQPAFVLAALAMATLMRSSELENKAFGRERALWFRNEAQTALDLAMSNHRVDAAHAQAALVLALFETSSHPQHSQERVVDALTVLDKIIHTISLTTIDGNDRDVSVFPSGCVPIVNLEAGPNDSADRKCVCVPPGVPQSPNPFTSWSYARSYALPWDSSWTDAQIKDEEARRLCWCSLSLVCNFLSQCIAFNQKPPEFFLSNPENYALLFPGEVLDRVSLSYRSADSPSPKESVWALYCRSMLLWSFCNRLRLTTINNEEKTELIFDAWAETQSLQDSFKIHSCNIDTALIYMCREYVYNTQFTITQALRSLQGLGSETPMFKRKQAEEWLYYQDRVIQVVKTHITQLGRVQDHQLTRRPFQVSWFLNQLSICLLLWSRDRSLKNALVLAKSILLPVEVMNALWPCPVLQRQSDDMRQKLMEACTIMGMDGPQAPSYVLPVL